MGCEEGDGVEFLECSTRNEVGFGGAGEEEERECIDVCIANLSSD